jgi:uncharacterized protein with von Willebrand factor type A (vWA) domain
MIRHLVGFVQALRDAGVWVSLAESLVAAATLSHISIEDREAVKRAWRAVLAKEVSAFPRFDQLFDRHFPARLNLGKLTEGNKEGQPGGEMLGEGKRREAPGEGTQAESETANSETASQAGEKRSQERREGDEAGEQADQVAAGDAERESETECQLRALLEQAQERDEGEREYALLRPATQKPLALTGDLPPDQVEDLYEAVEALAVQLVTRRSRRYRRARRGPLDLKRTIQRGFRRGELNTELVHRSRKLNKHDLVALCNISGSVWQVARFFLKLVQEIQSQFSRTRLFLFVDRIAEVTQVLADQSVEDAIAQFKREPSVNFMGRSDYGRAFYQFYNEHLDALSRHTVLVVLGRRTKQLL